MLRAWQNVYPCRLGVAHANLLVDHREFGNMNCLAFSIRPAVVVVGMACLCGMGIVANAEATDALTWLNRDSIFLNR